MSDLRQTLAGMVAQWRKRDPAGWQAKKCADELEATLSLPDAVAASCFTCDGEYGLPATKAVYICALCAGDYDETLERAEPPAGEPGPASSGWAMETMQIINKWLEEFEKAAQPEPTPTVPAFDPNIVPSAFAGDPAPAPDGSLEQWLEAFHVSLDQRQLSAVKGFIVMNYLQIEPETAVPASDPNIVPSAFTDEPVLCPSCRATDNNYYIDANGVAMRACGCCVIQWRETAVPAGPALREALVAIRNMAHRAWEDKPNVETMFRLIEKKAEDALATPRSTAADSDS